MLLFDDRNTFSLFVLSANDQDIFDVSHRRDLWHHQLHCHRFDRNAIVVFRSRPRRILVIHL